MTNSYKKEYPLAGFPGFGGGAGALAFKSAATKTYLDDVFSTFLYRGTGNQMVINNGIDLSTEGGLVWTKNRDTTYGHFLFDTERGTTKNISTNSTSSEGTETAGVNAFNSNGFSVGTNGTNDGAFNHTSYDYSAWTFRKAPGFFDVVTYTGNATARTISHSLGCIPGMIIVKRTNAAEDWTCYHRNLGGITSSGQYSSIQEFIDLNKTSAAQDDAQGDQWNNTAPTSTHFSVGTHARVNANNDTYVAYVFAGGESDAATARSVDFDGTGDDLSLPSSSDFGFGTGDFTFEAWIKPDNWSSTYMTIFTVYTTGGIFIGKSGSNFVVRSYNNANHIATTNFPEIGQWTHVAVTRSGSTLKLFFNGIEEQSASTSYNFVTGAAYISNDDYDNRFVGEISNLRIVKGTAVYTSSFRPPTEPLTAITNTKLLCCNSSSVTGATVPSSETYSIDVTASGSSAYTLSGTDRNGSVSGNNATVTINTGDTVNFAVNASGHPFYIRVSDGGANVSTPSATGQGSQSGTVSWTPNTAGTFYYQCGYHSGMIGTITVQDAITANGDPTASTDSPFDDPSGFKFGDSQEGIIKCGSYVGNGSATGPEIFLGFEPSFIILKNAEKTENWLMWDSMRGIVTDGNDARLFPNLTTAESSPGDFIDLTPTGFQINDNGGDLNEPNDRIIYVAIRRPDGYVGKPAEAGTEVFAMDTGAGGSTVPGFDSGFPVDLALARRPASSDNWYTYSRLTGTKYVRTDTSDAEGNDTNSAFDSNVGWYTAINNTYQSWMFKRHAGFDVVTYTGDGVLGRQIPHSLNKTVEMIWVKNRDGADRPWCIGHKDMASSNVWSYFLEFDTDQASQDNDRWNSTAPDSTYFTVGNSTRTNTNNGTYIAMLFSSVDGISKVDSWVGDGTNNRQITTGFQPRFLIVFLTNQGAGYDWQMMDSTRGFIGPNNNILKLNSSAAQSAQGTYFTPTSTGFTITESAFNGSSQNWIYYAHA